MFEEFKQVVTRPFTEEVSTATLIFYCVLYFIFAWIVFDMLRILTVWMAQNSQS